MKEDQLKEDQLNKVSLDVGAADDTPDEAADTVSSAKEKAAEQTHVSAPETTAGRANKAKRSHAKDWFNPFFFLFTVCLAMGLAALNSWIGPDTSFDPGDWHQTAQEDRPRLLTRLQLRLRRAELLRNPGATYRCACALATVATINNDLQQRTMYLEEATMACPNASPHNRAYSELLKIYQDSGRKQDAAALLDRWRQHMPTGYTVAYDLVPFYEIAAPIYREAGRTQDAQSCELLIERSRWMPPDYWFFVLPKANTLSPSKNPLFARGCQSIINGDPKQAEECFTLLAQGQPSDDDTLRGKIMLPVVQAMGKGTPESWLASRPQASPSRFAPANHRLYPGFRSLDEGPLGAARKAYSLLREKHQANNERLSYLYQKLIDRAEQEAAREEGDNWTADRIYFLETNGRRLGYQNSYEPVIWHKAAE